MQKYPELEVLISLDAVEAFCDGCFLPDAAVGGWGVRVLSRPVKGQGGVVGDTSGGVPDGVGNAAMEARAIAEALRVLRPCKGEVVIRSDQADLLEALRGRGRGTADGRHVRLVESFPFLCRALRAWRGREVTWKYVRSHDGNPAHNAAHVFAKFAARRCARRQARGRLRGRAPAPGAGSG